LVQRASPSERGLIILMGLPNATSVQQEMDALYGPFKSATYARGEKVVQEKLRQRGLARRNGERLPKAVLNLDFADLPTIVNGTVVDVGSDRPFDTYFTKEKILWSWSKVGFVPFTRSCLNNKRVRKELGQHTEDAGLENLQLCYDILADSIENDGFNPGIFDASIPTAVHVDRTDTDAEQVAQLLRNGKAFSASGQWNFFESCIGNAGVTLRAQQQQLQINEAARVKAADKKSEAMLKILDKAQTALLKFEVDRASLTEKDWDRCDQVGTARGEGGVPSQGPQEARTNPSKACNIASIVDNLYSLQRSDSCNTRSTRVTNCMKQLFNHR
jgi:hypothetical protein